MAEASKGVKRILQMDIMRGVAILLVLFAHTWRWDAGSSIYMLPMRLTVRFGWTGVDLFFVLSGYLIGGLLFAEIMKYGKLDIKRFLIRRAFKIWPMYLLLIVAMSIFFLITTSPQQTFAVMWPYFLHIQNYAHPFPLVNHDVEHLLHAWSLAVEEHFYLALPIFLWILTKCGVKWEKTRVIIISSIVLMLLCTFGRYYHHFYFLKDAYRPPPIMTHLRINTFAKNI